MNIYWCDPEKQRPFCKKPERFCGKYCTMTYNQDYSTGEPPLTPEEVDAENERIRELYEADRKKKAEMAAGQGGKHEGQS